MDPLKTLLNSAYARAKKGEYKSALEEFKVLLSHNPNHAGGLFGIAACHYRMGNVEEAQTFLERLLRVSPQHPEGRRLLKELQMEGLDSQGVAPVREDPLNPEYSMMDPFGTGLTKKNREIEVIPEWQSPGRDIPSIRETILEGKGSGASPFHIGRVYGDSWRFYRQNFKRLFWGGLICLFVGLGLLAPFIPWFVSDLKEGALLSPGRVLLLAFLYPATGLYSAFCFRLKEDAEISFGEIPQFAKFYPGILFCHFWMLIFAVIFMSLLYGVCFLIGILTGWPIVSWIFANVPVFVGGCLFYVWWRCWFLNQAVYLDANLHPLTILGRAFFSTSGQQFRLLIFTVLQTLLLILGLFFLGLGLPWVHLAQTEAFLETQRQKEGEAARDGIGFEPKRAGTI
ncbi:MAG: tetratricopeptide repeat protein [Candidatus Omnitrophica bacterium]|nr:tetratricopeptide repeat protein [Candidatus Omnitrophota bacterium]